MTTKERIYSGPVSQWEIGMIAENTFTETSLQVGRVAVGYAGEHEIVTPVANTRPSYLGVFNGPEEPEEVDYPQVGEFYD